VQGSGQPRRSPIAFFLALVAAVAVSVSAGATSVTIDFEGFPDSTILTNQYPGLTFSNAIILTAGSFGVGVQRGRAIASLCRSSRAPIIPGKNPIRRSEFRGSPHQVDQVRKT